MRAEQDAGQRRLTLVVQAGDDDAVLDTVAVIGTDGLPSMAADVGEDEAGDGARVTWRWETVADTPARGELERQAAYGLLQAVFGVEGAMSTGADAPDPGAMLTPLDRDQVYGLKWIFEQAVAYIENDFENRPEE